MITESKIEKVAKRGIYLGAKKTIARMIIGQNAAGCKVIDLLRNTLSLSNRQIKKIIATRGLFINGRPVHSEYKVICGQELKVKLPVDEQVKVQPLPMDLLIIYEDEGLLAVNKPHGISVHGTSPGGPPSLVNGVAYYLQSKNGLVTPRPVHRLDRDTSGVVLFAKSAAIQTELTNQWQTRQVIKKYWALVEGTPAQEGIISSPVKGKHAETQYHLIKKHDHFSEILAVITTGRTHQIRIHLQSIGHPVLGDRIYNKKSAITAGRLCLHALELALIHPVTKESLKIHTPISLDDFKITLKSNNSIQSD